MSELRCCPQCGTAVQPDAPEGLCPQCLLREAMKGESELGKEVGGTTTGAPGSIPPRPEELARQFPHLEILELLGQGGMGIVYKARQPRLDRFVALKILPAEAGRDPAFAERFAREARALAKLSHPNIVTVYDFGESDGRFYLLMEFVDGVNLRHLLREQRLKPEEALKIVPQICEALQYAHEQGVVHRDIKPENILLDKRGHIKIADFGLAKLLGQKAIDSVLTGSQQIMGTLHYMAPEQMEKPLTVDHRADIYSLGVVFYEMLTGELPLGRFAPPSQKVQLDVRLDEVVLRALEKEPERRYQHASDVKQQVESIQFATPVPSDGRQTPQGSGSREAAMQIVVGPADGLILIGLLAFVTALGVGLWLCLKWNEDLAQLTTSNLIGMSIANAVYGLFTSTAGALMRRLSARLFTLACIVVGGLFIPALGALNVALELKTIPQWPVLIPMWLGLPIAIWATLILFRHDVRAAFQSRPVPRAAGQPNKPQTEQRLEPSLKKRRAWPVLPFLMILGIYGLSFFLPAFSVHSRPPLHISPSPLLRGYDCFVTAMRGGPTLEWYANPVFWLGCLALLARRSFWAAATGLIAVVLAASPIFSAEEPVFLASTFLAGYWLWLFSMALLVGSGLWAWRSDRSTEAAKERERRPPLA